MNITDTRTILETIQALDPRIQATSETVTAWHDLLHASARDMPLAFAMQQIYDHTGRNTDRTIRPGDLITAWRTARQGHGTPTNTPILDSHCKRHGCRCTHTTPCYRGWNDNNPGQFCKTCNPIRQAAIDDMPKPGQRSQFDFDAFIAKAKL